MKIVHLATSLGGGAGIAARRISEAQYENNMDVTLIAHNGNAATLRKHEKILPRTVFSPIASKTLTFFQSSVIQRDLRLTTPLSLTRDLFSIDEVKLADLVHFHAFYNLATVDNIISLSRHKNVVVTLHDQRFFTGGCHYSFDCKGFQSGCAKCPQVRRIFNQIPRFSLKESEKEIKNSKSIRFISPSKWLADIASSSALLSGQEFTVLPNPVPKDFQSHISNRRPKDRIKLGFISENLNNPYKGLSLLIQALRKVDNPEKFELLLFGHSESLALPENISIKVKSFSDTAGSVEAYKSCDVIVVPSLQDNSPSVVSEALMCGIPVLGSDTGGIPEVLKEFGMQVFESGSVESLTTALNGLRISPVSKENQLLISERFSYSSSAAAHNELYLSSFGSHL
jgi:glycosyltransferase involved in cell wall biosynthesis